MNMRLRPEQLRSLIPLNALSARQIKQLSDQLVAQPLLAGQPLSVADDSVRASYFLLAGALSFQDPDGREQRLAAGSVESSRAFATGTYPADVRALEDSSILIINSDELDRLLSWRQAFEGLLLDLSFSGELADWLEPMLENPLFAKVPSENIQRMLSSLEPLDVPAGQQLLQEGEVGDCCYFLTSGRAEVQQGWGGEQQIIAELAIGACFGEEALLSERPRNATVTMIEEGSVLRLDRKAFIALLKSPVVTEISLDEAENLLAAQAQWLDVRLLDEYQQGHAARALNMPLHLLRLKARLLDERRTYLCYCDSGKRSAAAVFLLAQLGFIAYPLRGGLGALEQGQRTRMFSEQGAGYLARSGGRTERSAQ